MKHAQRIVVLSEDEYIKLKALGHKVTNSDSKIGKNAQLDKIAVPKATADSNTRKSTRSNNLNNSDPDNNNRKTTLSISKPKRKNASRRRRVKESESFISRLSSESSRHNNNNKSKSSIKNWKQKRKNKNDIEKRLLWITNDVSRKIKQNLLDGERDVDNSEIIAPPAVQKPITIQSYFKPQYKSLVSAIVTDLKQIGVKFKENYEVQLPYGDRIEGSNIVRLMKELVTGSTMSARRPIGWKLFLTLVAQTNTPLPMFAKQYVRNRIAKIRSDQPWEEY